LKKEPEAQVKKNNISEKSQDTLSQWVSEW